MFGTDLLVAPILDADTYQRRVYLPANSTWKDAWTDQVFDGGQWLSVEAPLDQIPLFFTGDCILPIQRNIILPEIIWQTEYINLF